VWPPASSRGAGGCEITGRLVTSRGLPRDLHPAAWWAWALGLATAASRTTNPLLLGLVVAVAVVTVLARRSDAPWARFFRLYLALALVVVLVRVLGRVLLGGGYGARVLLDLPRVPLPDWAAGITLLGPVTAEAVLSGVYDGLQLGAILVCVGAANTLANPRRLLAALPPALYEVGTAVVIALSLFPQLAESVHRVRLARRLRGDPGRGVAALRRVVVPVLEDAFERSLTLAASMDARGYGRSGTAGATERRVTGTLLVTALIGLCAGSYGLLDRTAPRALGAPLLAAGVAVALVGLWAAGRRVRRTRYRPDRWRFPDLLTALTGLAVAALVMRAADAEPLAANPDPATLPVVSVPALLAVLLGILPAVATPPPVQVGAGSTPSAARSRNQPGLAVGSTR